MPNIGHEAKGHFDIRRKCGRSRSQKKVIVFLKKCLTITFESAIMNISNKERRAAEIGADGGYYEKV